MRRAMQWVGCLLVVILLAPVAYAWPDERPSGNTFTCKEIKVPMRDGTQLATDLYLPDGNGPFPVVIERTPYDKGDCGNGVAPYLAQRGYVVLIQDVRGRFNSPGEFYNFRDEGWGKNQDGYDTIEWAAKQAWSDGKVGTMGTSYSCFNQNLTAVAQPPHLKAMFCADSASSWFTHRYQGGALGGNGLDWMVGNAEAAKPILMNRPGPAEGMEEVQDWLNWNTRRIEKGQSLWESWIAPILRDFTTHTTYDDYWRQYAPIEHLEKFNVPVFYMSGWYDRYPEDVTEMFNGIRKRSESPLARESVRVMIGPWLHGGTTTTRARKVGDMDFGPEAAVHAAALRVRWFDYHLKGMDNGMMKEGPVWLFVMGANKWRQEKEFPLSRAVATKFYLHPAKSGSINSLNDGTLSRQMPPQNASPNTYTYDPRTPTPSIGGDLFIQPSGVRDHRPVDAKSLTFTTEAFREDMEVTGPGTVELFASSSVDDTDFVVTLTDVRPDGYSAILRQDVLRASRRESLENPKPIEPGKVYKLTITVNPVSNVFKAGHRLRLTVTSSSFPRWMPNHNKFMLNNEEAPYAVASNTIYHDAQRPSVLTLPVIPSQ